ncbi:MAG: nucleotidyltransferase family protein, partial [Sulfuritalea sp.]|nr:nucleotidyltransferase family protein [Sulfuritalea sp.]
EVTFHSPAADIDLHWNILRPGRTRVDLTPELLGRRVRVNGFWGLSDDDSTFLMLTHPAFAKYICSPHMGLGRVMAFLLWSQKVDVHWPAVLALLERAGLKTAAWAMLTWFVALAPASLQPRLSQWRESVRPGRLRAWYLERWIRHNLPTRLLAHAWLIQFGLTGFLHDRPSDVWVAFRGWHSSRRNRETDAREFLAARDCLP